MKKLRSSNTRRFLKKDSPKESSVDFAFNKLMIYVSQRNHSVKELRAKLRRFYEDEHIDLAISRAETHGWLMKPEELALQASLTLHRKKKGFQFIRQFLKEKGLPEVAKDPLIEIEKAEKLLSKFKFPLSWAQESKARQFLSRRGFDFETISATLRQMKEQAK